MLIVDLPRICLRLFSDSGRSYLQGYWTDRETKLNLDLFTPYSATVLKRPVRKALNKQQLFRLVLTGPHCKSVNKSRIMVRVLFLHPDLGIGGAERLIVDAALALKSRGHTVSFLTNHHDPGHCFEETRDGTLSIETVGDWLPRTIFGKLAAFCAYFRMIYAAFYTVFVLSRKETIDVIICDQISHGIPVLKLAQHRPKIIFYCHFPDQLLAKPGSLLKQAYRAPLNYLEELTTGQADAILVNSKFTRGVFKSTFRSLSHLEPEVLYPSLNTDFFDKAPEVDEKTVDLPRNANFVMLSLNRYERKKNLPLAIEALKEMEGKLSKPEFDRVQLVIAGGYDVRVPENVEHLEELQSLAKSLELTKKITFLRSPTDAMKLWLLRKVDVVVYTPENEHFGIVPLEAMYSGRPVIAANSGGPTETIIHDQTGFLCDPNAHSFHEPMLKLFKDKKSAEAMGEMGRKRVQQKFSFAAFTDKLEDVVTVALVRAK